MPSIYTRKDGTAVRYDTKEYDAQYRSALKAEPHWCQSCQKLIGALNVHRHLRSIYHFKRLPEEPEPIPEPIPEPTPEPVAEPEPVPMELKESRPKIYTMTVKEMKAKAKELNLKGYSKMTKPELEQLITQGNIGAPIEVTKEVKEPVKEVKEPAPAPAAEVKEPAATKTKAISPWNAFLSEYRKENNVSLKEAMKQKDAYATWKGKSAA